MVYLIYKIDIKALNKYDNLSKTVWFPSEIESFHFT